MWWIMDMSLTRSWRFEGYIACCSVSTWGRTVWLDATKSKIWSYSKIVFTVESTRWKRTCFERNNFSCRSFSEAVFHADGICRFRRVLAIWKLVTGMALRLRIETLFVNFYIHRQFVDLQITFLQKCMRIGPEGLPKFKVFWTFYRVWTRIFCYSGKAVSSCWANYWSGGEGWYSV